LTPGRRSNKNKKPEQPHYSAKKVTGPTSQGGGSGAPEVDEGIVVGKPPTKPTADDAKSDGGGSNTGTGRRKNKNRNRPTTDLNSTQDSLVCLFLTISAIRELVAISLTYFCLPG